MNELTVLTWALMVGCVVLFFLLSYAAYTVNRLRVEKEDYIEHFDTAIREQGARYEKQLHKERQNITDLEATIQVDRMESENSIKQICDENGKLEDALLTANTVIKAVASGRAALIGGNKVYESQLTKDVIDSALTQISTALTSNDSW